MSAAAPSIVPILATPFGVMPLPAAKEHNEALAGVLAARAASDTDPARTANPLCYRSADDLLEWPDSLVQGAGTEILRGMYTVIAATSELTAVQLGSLVPQARCWFTIIRPDGALASRSYPMTSWCAIYCVAAPPPSATRRDSGALRLYETRLGTMFQDASNAALRMPYATCHYAWLPVPGELAVFPAALTHEISLVRAPGELILITMRLRFVAPGQTGFASW